jgi:flagellar hook-associated protein 2
MASSMIDVNSIVSQLMQVEQQPLMKLIKKENSVNASISELGALRSQIYSLQTALLPFKDTARFTTMLITNTYTDYIDVKADSTADAGPLPITITQLASPLRLVGDQLTTTDFTFSGVANLIATISFGSIVDATWTAHPTKVDNTLTIPVSDDAISLDQVRDAIYDDGAIDVQMSILKDTETTTRAIWTGSLEGENNAFKVALTATDSAGVPVSLTGNDILELEFDPVTWDSGASTGSEDVYTNFRIKTPEHAAKDANFTAYSVPITSESNTVTDALTGLTLTLKKLTDVTNPILNITIDKNSSGVNGMVSNFINNYKDLRATLKNLPSLEKDAFLLSLDRRLRSMMTQTYGNTAQGYSSPSEWGFSFDKFGTLSLDAKELSDALETNKSKVIAFFGAYDVLENIYSTPVSEQNGFYYKWNEMLEDMLVTPDGTLDGKTASLKNSLNRIADEKLTVSRHLTAKEKAYRSQYAALDVKVSALNDQEEWLTQQFKVLNRFYDK